MKNHIAALKMKMSSTPARRKLSPQTSGRRPKGIKIKVVELRRATSGALKDINNLLPQLSETAKPLSLKLLKAITKDKNTCLSVAKDGTRIVGMGTLVIFLTPHSRRARIEDVVVDKEYRGQRIGERISQELISLAKRKKVKSIELSSRPSRRAANALYRKLGFKKRETNVYSLSFR